MNLSIIAQTDRLWLRVVALICAVATPSPAQSDFDAPQRVFDNDRVIDPGWPTGVVMGGIGAGFVEWGASGALRTVGITTADPVTADAAWWEIEIATATGVLRRALLQDGTAPAGEAGVASVRFRGSFPRAFWSFRDPAVGLDVFVEAFSPFVPHDLLASADPVVGFRFTVTGPPGAITLRLRGWPGSTAIDALCVGGAEDPARPGAAGERVLERTVAWYRADAAYAPRFADAAAVAAALLRDFEPRRARTRAWQELVHRADLPLWYRDRLINDLAPLVANSHFLADGTFGITEAGRGLGRILGTLDQRLVAHAAVQMFFPELDRAELRVFAEQQRDDGEVQHHFGRVGVGREPGRGFLGWPDLAASFVLQVYKHQAWTGEVAFRDEMLPHVERALRWLVAADRDGDGIAEGGSTFDDAERGDGMAYIGSVSLAAFEAGRRLAQVAGNGELEEFCAAAFARTRSGMIDALWNGRYFAHFIDPTTGAASTDCFLGQLAGEWFAALMGFGPLLPPARIDRALASMVALNGAASPYIPPLEVSATGRIGRTPYGWLPYTAVYYAGLLIHRGRADDGMLALRRLDQTLYRARDPFDVVLYYDAITGGRARPGYEWYMSTPASWLTLAALLGASVDVPQAVLYLRPQPPTAAQHLSGPVFLPRLTGWLDHQRAAIGSRDVTTFRVLEQHGGDAVEVRSVVIDAPADAERVERVTLEVDGVARACTEHTDPAGLALRPALPIRLVPGTEVAVVRVDEAIERAAATHRALVAEREAMLENEHLRVALFRGDSGLDRITLTERVRQVSAVLDARHLFRLSLPIDGRMEQWLTDPAQTRRVRVVRSAHRLIDANTYELSLELEIRSGRDAAPLTPRVTVRVVLAADAPRLTFTFRIDGQDLPPVRGKLEFPILLAHDPGRIGEPSRLITSTGVILDDPVHSDAVESAGYRGGDARILLVGPEATLSMSAPQPGALRSLYCRGTRGDAVELSVWQPLVGDARGAVAPVAVEIEWR